MTEILAGVLCALLWITILIFETDIFKKHIVPLISKKEPDEIEMLEQTLWRKNEELNRRNQIEMLSSEIERLDEHLYPEYKEERRERLNDSMDALMYSLDNESKRPSNPKRKQKAESIRYGEKPHTPINQLKPVFCAQSNCDRVFLAEMPHSFSNWFCDECSAKKAKEPGPTYPEKTKAYADSVVIEESTTYPPLKNVGGTK
ncbi:hypothetical protein [Salinicoccus sp. HZC-1]|uniref:hypothetical protein n=1 Tax=Salinicoccus sp. HZC-1 TaxID=3385497 RepID=UPI00398AB43C